MTLYDVSEQSEEIRNRYHALEKQIHGSVWSVEEDALAILAERMGLCFSDCVEDFLKERLSDLTCSA